MRKTALFTFLLVFLSAIGQKLTSPKGNFELNFELNNGVPTYNLLLDGETVIAGSSLGFALKDQG